MPVLQAFKDSGGNLGMPVKVTGDYTASLLYPTILLISNPGTPAAIKPILAHSLLWS
jgi:hypothetical protein